MNADERPEEHPRALPVPSMVIIIGLGMLWLAAFVYAAGLQYLALGLVASASVVAFTLLVSWALGALGSGTDLAEQRALRRGRIALQNERDSQRRTAVPVMNAPYRAARLHRPPDRPATDWRSIDRPGTRAAGHHRRPGAHRRQPER